MLHDEMIEKKNCVSVRIQRCKQATGSKLQSGRNAKPRVNGELTS